MPTNAPKHDAGGPTSSAGSSIKPNPGDAPRRTFLFEADPVADPRAVVVFGDARFTILTSALIRMEWAPDARFEDRASQAFVNRKLPVPTFDVERSTDRITIRTGSLALTYHETGEGFTDKTLSVVLTQLIDGKTVFWKPGTPETGNLMGTARTLDGFSGAAPLEPGILSRDGWALVDDSKRLLFDGSSWEWMTPRAEHGGAPAVDWYFFGHGRDYARALKEFTMVSGPIPMVPRYVLGSWFSRYWPYADHEYKAIIDEYRAHGVGIDVLVLDMDWHLDGWTGYTWNPRYFPDAPGFLRWCRENRLHTTLNLHPADGVGKHESAFRSMAAAMGAPRHVYRIPFDCASKEFMRAYFDVLHHPLEEQGVDFWWMDWQQGTDTKIPGLDPLFWLNHLHWQDMHTNPKRGDLRPLVFSRWGGLGNHRYQIGFSGDTFNDWESLAFQPYFTATAANVGYAWWSHDIGGHQPGPVEDELYVRWVQYGIFSPVLRLHSGREPRAERRIWKFSDEAFAELKEAFRFRYALVAYTYSATRRSYEDGVSLCRPLYHDWPDETCAYDHPNQYMFGDDLMIAPVVGPMQRTSGGAPVDVWVPQGEDGGWVEWFTGRMHNGGSEVRLLVPLDEIPVFVRAGAVVCEYPDALRTPDRVPETLIVNIFPGASGETSLYEDDGQTNGYAKGAFARTPIEHHAEPDGARTIAIGPATGHYIGMPERRAHEIRLQSHWPLASVEVDGAALHPVAPGLGPGFWFDPRTLSAVISVDPRSVRDPVTIRAVPSVRGEPARAMTKGLRGQLALLDDLADVLGAAAPAQLNDARAIRNRIAKDPISVARDASAMQASWWSMIGAIRACGAPGDVKDRAIARLLGMSCEICVEPIVGDPDVRDVLAVRADLAFAPRFDAPAELPASLRIESSAGWAIAKHEVDPARRLQVGQHMRARAVVRAEGTAQALQTGHVVAHATITDGAHRIDVSADQAFCPSINAWWLVGPFPCPWDEQLEKEFIDIKAIDPSKPVVREDGTEVAWIKARRTLAPGQKAMGEYRIDLLYSFDEKKIDYAVAYAACDLDSDADREVELAIGSDDGVKVWVNGKVVHAKQLQRGYRPKEDRVIVRLNKGRNRLVMKITQAEAGWGFGAHVQDLSGLTVPGVQVRLDF